MSILGYREKNVVGRPTGRELFVVDGIELPVANEGCFWERNTIAFADNSLSATVQRFGYVIDRDR